MLLGGLRGGSLHQTTQAPVPPAGRPLLPHTLPCLSASRPCPQSPPPQVHGHRGADGARAAAHLHLGQHQGAPRFLLCAVRCRRCVRAVCGFDAEDSLGWIERSASTSPDAGCADAGCGATGRRARRPLRLAASTALARAGQAAARAQQQWRGPARLQQQHNNSGPCCTPALCPAAPTLPPSTCHARRHPGVHLVCHQLRPSSCLLPSIVPLLGPTPRPRPPPSQATWSPTRRTCRCTWAP